MIPYVVVIIIQRIKMLKKAYIIAVFIVCGVLLHAGPAPASNVGGLSYNIGPSFSVGAGVGFSMHDIHVIENDDISDQMSTSRFLVKADIAPIRYVDIYGLIGVGDLQLDDGDYSGSLGTTYGGGLRPQLFPLTWKSPLNVTLDAQYLETQTRDSTMAARLMEFQASLIASYVMRSLAPYGGIKYDRMAVQFDGSTNDIEGDMDWGAFIGCDYFVTQNVFFNLELSIFTETAVFLATGFKY
ncbi:MAG: porin family protein [Myxococcales bacterium]|nr:porin family protein [Myxococcales bacterium]